MKLSTLVSLATVVTFIAAVLVGGYFANIVTRGSLHDPAFILVLSSMVTSAIASGRVISVLLPR